MLVVSRRANLKIGYITPYYVVFAPLHSISCYYCININPYYARGDDQKTRSGNKNLSTSSVRFFDFKNLFSAKKKSPLSIFLRQPFLSNRGANRSKVPPRFAAWTRTDCLFRFETIFISSDSPRSVGRLHRLRVGLGPPRMVCNENWFLSLFLWMSKYEHTRVPLLSVAESWRHVEISQVVHTRARASRRIR